MPALPYPHSTYSGSGGAVTPSMLIFDLEAVDNVKDTRPCARTFELLRSLQVLTTPQTHFEARLLHDVRTYKQRLIKEEGHVDIVVLATNLAAVGYRVAVRTALGGGSGQECFQNLHYEFLLVSDEHNSVELTVDPRFREQFYISHSTEEYRELLANTPEEYVGSSARLGPLVKLLCSCMQGAFEAAGLTCPPWRRASSMISKWVPSKARDLEVVSPSSSPEGYYGKGLVGLSPRGPLSRSNSGATTSSTVSPRTCPSRQSSMPTVVAKPLLRQAGFQLSFPEAIAEQSFDGPSAESGKRRSQSLGAPKSAKENIFKESRTSSGVLTGVLSVGGRVNTAALQTQNVDSAWQTPRICTVKMAGERGK